MTTNPNRGVLQWVKCDTEYADLNISIKKNGEFLPMYNFAIIFPENYCHIICFARIVMKEIKVH